MAEVQRAKKGGAKKKATASEGGAAPKPKKGGAAKRSASPDTASYNPTVVLTSESLAVKVAKGVEYDPLITCFYAVGDGTFIKLTSVIGPPAGFNGNTAKYVLGCLV